MQFPLLRAEAIRGSSSAAVYSATTMMTIRSRSRRIPRWRSTELLFQTPTVTTTQCNSSSSSGNITTTHQRGRLLDATGTSAVVPTRRRRRRRSSRSPHSELWQQPPPPPRTQPESVAAQCLVCVGPQQLRLLPLVAGMPDVWWVQSQSHPKPRLRLPKGAAPGAAPPPPPRHAADWWYTPSFTTTTTTTTRLNNINQSHAISRMMPNRSTPLHPQQKQCRWRSTSSTTTPTESRPPSLPTEPEASLATAATTAVLQPTIPATTTGSTTKNDAMAAAAAASLAAIQQQVAALLPDLPTGSRRSSSSGTYPHPQQQLQQQQQQQPDVVWAKADFARIRRNILDPLLLIVLIRMESSSSSSPSLVATTTTQCTAIHLALHVLERLVQELLRTHHHQIQQQMATFQPPAAPRTQSSSAGIARTKQLRDEQQLDPFEQLDWIYHRRYIYPIVNCWRDLVFASAISITTTTTKNDAILAPRDMLQKLQKISILAPTSDTHDDNNMFNNRCRRVFPYDIIAIGMIMSVVQLRSPRVEAPLVMERILNFAKQQSQELEEAEPTESGWSATATAAKSIQNGKSRMREKPDVYLYSQVLQVWSQSGLPQASSRITELWNEMKQDRSNNNGSFSYSIAPNEVSYNIVISYWSNQGKAAILESIICDMKQEGFEISPICLAHAIRCFTRQDVDNSLLYAQKAADFTGTLAKVLQQQSPNAKRQTYLPQATEDVMQAFSRNCTRIGNSPSSSRQKQHQYAQLLQSAETFVQVMDRSRCLHTFQYDWMVGILIDMYAQNRTPFAQTEKFLQSLEVGVRDHFIYDSMIRAFAKHGHPEMATPLLLSVLDSSGAVNVSPNAGTFARVISAWAESSLPQALEQATAVFRHLESHPVCVEARVRPTTVIYGSLLKCLSVSKRPDSGKSAVAILDDMTSKSSSDATIRPDLIVYTLVIKTCLHAGDTERFQEVWKRMQQSDTPPNVRTYSDVLNHYAETGTLAGARQAHQILLEMKSNAAIKNPDPESTSIQQAAVQPNSFTYNIVVKAWCRSGDESATERIWEIYQMSLADGISPDVFMYSQLIHHLCTSGKIDNVRRSDLALQAMEEDSTIAGKTFSLYSHVLQSYAKLGDADNASRVLIRIIEVYLSGGFVNSRSKPGQKQQQQQPPAQYPRPILFQTVIWAWIRSGQVLQATLIADKLQELHDAKRIPEGPDLRVYQTLLAAWNESKQLGHDKDNEDESRAQKARHVRRLQDRIENLERRQKSQT